MGLCINRVGDPTRIVFSKRCHRTLRRHFSIVHEDDKLRQWGLRKAAKCVFMKAVTILEDIMTTYQIMELSILCTEFQINILALCNK